jgi:hypothetical protein
LTSSPNASGGDYSGIRIPVSRRKYNGFFSLFIRIFLSVVMLRQVALVRQDKTVFYHRFISVRRWGRFGFFPFSACFGNDSRYIRYSDRIIIRNTISFMSKNIPVIVLSVRLHNIITVRFKMMGDDIVNATEYADFIIPDCLNDFPYPFMKLPANINRFAGSCRFV